MRARSDARAKILPAIRGEGPWRADFEHGFANARSDH